jgi:hypothetical protein
MVTQKPFGGASYTKVHRITTQKNEILTVNNIIILNVTLEYIWGWQHSKYRTSMCRKQGWATNIDPVKMSYINGSHTLSLAHL